MSGEEERRISQYGYQPLEEKRGFQPSNQKPQSPQPNHSEVTIQSNGNVAQNK